MLGVGAVGVGAMAEIGRTTIKTSKAANLLQAATSANADEMDRMKGLARDIGGRLPLDVSDILDAQRQFFKLGNTVETAMAAVPGIAELAVAGEGIDVSSASRYIAIALKAFNLGPEMATRVADMMLKAETITAGSARGIGEAFQYSAKTASIAGVPIHEYIALLGGMAESGRDVESSSQGLQAMISRLAAAIAEMKGSRGGKMIKDIFGHLDVEPSEVKGIWETQDNCVREDSRAGLRARGQRARTADDASGTRRGDLRVGARRHR